MAVLQICTHYTYGMIYTFIAPYIVTMPHIQLVYGTRKWQRQPEKYFTLLWLVCMVSPSRYHQLSASALWQGLARGTVIVGIRSHPATKYVTGVWVTSKFTVGKDRLGGATGNSDPEFISVSGPGWTAPVVVCRGL